jgi:hypothetical protein
MSVRYGVRRQKKRSPIYLTFRFTMRVVPFGRLSRVKL